LNTASDPQSPIQSPLAGLEPITLRLVDEAEGPLFRQFIQRYHYLGYRVPVGANLRYFVRSADGRILAALQWTSPAWKMAARDRWIGWNPQQRARNLQYIVSNGRFLILPWVQVKTLASTILARAARQVPVDWQQHYGYQPLLFETLWMLPDSRGLVIAPRTGSVLEKPRVAAEWIVITKRRNPRSSSSYSLCIATAATFCVSPNQPGKQIRFNALRPSRMQGEEERGLDKKPRIRLGP
jgi:hypothetical protein